MKINYLLKVIAFTLFTISIYGQQFVTDVIVLKGELHVTPDINTENVLRKLDRELMKRRMVIIDNQIERRNRDSILYAAEIYVYQYIGENPVVNFQIRSEEGIHYEYWEKVTSFVSRKTAIEEAISAIFFNLPRQFDLSIIEKKKIESKLYYHPNGRLGKKKIINAIQTLYPTELSQAVKFIPNNFNDYLASTIHVSGMKDYLINDTLNIKIDINEHGKAIYKGYDFSITVVKEQEERYKDFVESIPTLKIDKKYTDLNFRITVDESTTEIIKEERKNYYVGIVAGILIGLLIRRVMRSL